MTQTKSQTVDRLVYKDHESFTIEGWLGSADLECRYRFSFQANQHTPALLDFQAELITEDPTVNRIILR